MSKEKQCAPACACVENTPNLTESAAETPVPQEINGFAAKKLPEPTRFGDWEVGGRCSDF